jgi:N utilization substance protein B
MKIVQNLFAQIFYNNTKNLPNEDETTIEEIKPHLTTLDELIKKNAPKYPLDRIAKIDLAILRLAIYELIIEQTEPPKVIIDEAVTLAKEFGGDRSYAFINAVLGAVYKDAVEQGIMNTPEDKQSSQSGKRLSEPSEEQTGVKTDSTEKGETPNE